MADRDLYMVVLFAEVPLTVLFMGMFFVTCSKQLWKNRLVVTTVEALTILTKV